MSAARLFPRLACLVLVTAALVAPIGTMAGGAMAQTSLRPQPPCTAAVPPIPGYGALGAAPEVRVWQDLDFRADPADGPLCFGALQGRFETVVALAGQFRHAGGLDELAARFGAISAGVGLRYWSTSDQAWRSLISEATALAGPDPAAERPDFTAEELRSGAQLYFMQNDTRSSGANVYRLRALASAPGRLVVEVVNEGSIGVAFLTFFEPGALISLHVFERIADDVWGYYSLSAVREGSVSGRENSLINRAAAFYRFLRGQPGDAALPLAP